MVKAMGHMKTDRRFPAMERESSREIDCCIYIERGRRERERERERGGGEGRGRRRGMARRGDLGRGRTGERGEKEREGTREGQRQREEQGEERKRKLVICIAKTERGSDGQMGRDSKKEEGAESERVHKGLADTNGATEERLRALSLSY
jgi:hypothetical protein